MNQHCFLLVYMPSLPPLCYSPAQASSSLPLFTHLVPVPSQIPRELSCQHTVPAALIFSRLKITHSNPPSHSFKNQHDYRRRDRSG
jgi:hypothetical protein